MFFFDLLFVLLLTIILTAVFAVGFRGRRGGAALLSFFLLLLLVTWAGGIWLSPIGYPFYGIPWLSFLVVGVLFALLLTALIPPAAPRSTERENKEADAAISEFAAFNLFFWILLVLLLIAIWAAYV